jgi:uncharacterized protein
MPIKSDRPIKSERFEMRLDPAAVERIDAWRREQPDLPSRTEAIRRLVELGLGAKREGGK